MPSPAPRSAFGEVGLPSVPAGLPELSRGATPARGSVELPSLGMRGRASSPGFELDDGLPLVGGNLPALSGAGLPERSHAGLPSLGGGLPVYQSSGLPSPSASGLPAVGGPGLPSVPPELDSLDLDVGRAPSLPPDFGLDPVQPRSVRASRAEFGELELPLGGAPSLPPSAAGHGAEGEEADLFGEVAPHAALRNTPAARAAAEAIVRQSGGGTAYGEVNLGDEGAEAEVPIESGAVAPPRAATKTWSSARIPQEDQPRAAAGAAGPTHVAMPIGRGTPEMLKRKRKLDLRLYGGLFVVFVAGAALALVPSVGPFGAYLLIDQLKAGEYAKLTESTVKQAQSAMAKDTYPEAKLAISAVEASRASAKRVRQLPAYAAFTAFAKSFASARIQRSTLAARYYSTNSPSIRTPPTWPSHAARARPPKVRSRAPSSSSTACPSPPQATQIKPFYTVKSHFARVIRRPRPRSGSRLHGRKRVRAVPSVWPAPATQPLTPRQPPLPHATRSRRTRAMSAPASCSRGISSAARTGEAEALRLLGSITESPALASPDELVNAQTCSATSTWRARACRKRRLPTGKRSRSIRRLPEH